MCSFEIGGVRDCVRLRRLRKVLIVGVENTLSGIEAVDAGWGALSAPEPELYQRILGHYREMGASEADAEAMAMRDLRMIEEGWPLPDWMVIAEGEARREGVPVEQAAAAVHENAMEADSGGWPELPEVDPGPEAGDPWAGFGDADEPQADAAFAEVRGRMPFRESEEVARMWVSETLTGSLIHVLSGDDWVGWDAPGFVFFCGASRGVDGPGGEAAKPAVPVVLQTVEGKTVRTADLSQALGGRELCSRCLRGWKEVLEGRSQRGGVTLADLAAQGGVRVVAR